MRDVPRHRDHRGVQLTTAGGTPSPLLIGRTRDMTRVIGASRAWQYGTGVLIAGRQGGRMRAAGQLGGVTVGELARGIAHAPDWLRACGIDRWLGGVELSGNGPVWRWDPEREKLRHA